MRTIKFRGKSINSGEWVYGDLFQCEDNMYILPDDYCPDFEVIPETVGQFTGLFDKDGAEIYENDKISKKKHKDPNNWASEMIHHKDDYEIVIFDNGAFRIDSTKQPLHDIIHSVVYPHQIQYEVTGNIHDKTSDQ